MLRNLTTGGVSESKRKAGGRAPESLRLGPFACTAAGLVTVGTEGAASIPHGTSTLSRVHAGMRESSVDSESRSLFGQSSLSKPSPSHPPITLTCGRPPPAPPLTPLTLERMLQKNSAAWQERQKTIRRYTNCFGNSGRLEAAAGRQEDGGQSSPWPHAVGLVVCGGGLGVGGPVNSCYCLPTHPPPQPPNHCLFL